jgi:hypothetical protein
VQLYNSFSDNQDYDLRFVDNQNAGFVFVEKKMNDPKFADSFEVAKIIASNNGDAITIRRVINRPGIANPDLYVNAVATEVKTSRIATASSIDNLLRATKDQASNIILNVKNGIKVNVLESAIYNRVQRMPGIQHLTVIYNNSSCVIVSSLVNKREERE